MNFSECLQLVEMQNSEPRRFLLGRSGAGRYSVRNGEVVRRWQLSGRQHDQLRARSSRWMVRLGPGQQVPHWLHVTWTRCSSQSPLLQQSHALEYGKHDLWNLTEIMVKVKYFSWALATGHQTALPSVTTAPFAEWIASTSQRTRPASAAISAGSSRCWCQLGQVYKPSIHQVWLLIWKIKF